MQDPVQNIGKSYHLILLNTQNMTVTMYCIVRKCLIDTVEVIYYMYSTVHVSLIIDTLCINSCIFAGQRMPSGLV